MTTEKNITALDEDSSAFDDQKASKTFTKENLPCRSNENEIIYTKRNVKKIIDRKIKHKCKILKFSPEWTFNEILENLSKLRAKCFPYLLNLTIEMENFGFCESEFNTLKHFVLKFMKNRPIVLQLISINEEKTKFYYRDDTFDELIYIDEDMQNVETFQDFPTFFCCLMNRKIANFDDDFIHKLLSIKSSNFAINFYTLFLKSLGFPEDFKKELVLKCASKGSTNDILAALELPFENDGIILSYEAQYLTESFDSDDASIETSKSNENISNQQNDSTSKSVLLCAVENSNTDVINFLIESCTHLIQQLPVDHQIHISTVAFSTNQLNVLCDLLEFSDFPFPNKFNENSFTNERLRRITKERKKFHGAILEENFSKILQFNDKYPNIKLFRSTVNQSALSKALDFKKYEIFLRLKSLGFQATEFDDYRDIIVGSKELKKVNKIASRITQENVKESIQSNSKSVMLLCARSFIHNRKISKEIEKEYRKKIKIWYECIYKTEFGSKLFDAVAQCEKLKIIYDFECENVENVDLKNSSGALGTTYAKTKLIFIGAKVSEDNQEQSIKGVIAHELCHYAMRLIYENCENPYYDGDDESSKIFDDIVVQIEKISLKNCKDCEDDECEGIISTVYEEYEKDDQHPELIVRPVQILVQFDNDEEKTAYLKEKYAILFKYFIRFVLPELEKFNLSERENVMKFNKIVGVVANIESKELEVTSDGDIKNIFDNQNVVIASNVPRLLLINIHKYLEKGSRNLVNSKNVFITPEILNNETILEDFKEILKNNSGLKVFVDCAKDITQNFSKLISAEDVSYYLVVSNKTKSDEILKILHQKRKNVVIKSIIFSWNDFTRKNQERLLELKVRFQSTKDCSILKLVSEKNFSKMDEFEKQEEITNLSEELSNIVDDQLLNLLVENSINTANEISINTDLFEGMNNDKKFKFLFRPRKFLKFSKNKSNESGTEMSREELLTDVRSDKYVLISDIAGTGKSWALKNIAQSISLMYQTHWVSYVDLKQFTNVFKLENPLEFPEFITKECMNEHTYFEKEIFKKLYQNGRVVVLFDGFDEICPNYYEKVTELFENFEFNDGNQLWISTRDHFEADLQEKFGINAAYKLDKFTEKDGINFIASSWILNDQVKESVEIKSFTNCSSKYQNYQDLAQKLIKKISNMEKKLIGLPQFYKMIEFVFKDNKNPEGKFNMLMIYTDFVKILIRKWQFDKGELRENRGIEAQFSTLSYGEIHQYFAMKSLFPDENEFCDLDYYEDEWPDEEIVGCGLMVKINDNFLFPHETFREYYVAVFIISILKKGGKPDFEKYFFQFLTSKKFEIVRIFLNEALAEGPIMKIIDRRIKKLSKCLENKISELDDLSEIFREDLEHLFCFLLNLLKNSEYKKVKEILDDNVEQIIFVAQNPKLFTSFYEFFAIFLEIEDLKNFILAHDLMKIIAKSNLSPDVLVNFCAEIKSKLGLDFIQKLLKLKDSDDRNLLLYLCSLQYNYGKVLKIYNEIFRTYFKRSELLDLFQEHDKDKKNILHISVESKNMDTLKIMWSKIQLLFAIEDSLPKLKQLVFNKCSTNGRNVLHLVASCEYLNFHKSFWLLLLKTFALQEELKKLIIEKDNSGLNYLHILVIKGDPEIVEFTFRTIKEEISANFYKDILIAKDSRERNLLQIAATASKNIQIHKILWGVFKNLFKSVEEFLEILHEGDEVNNNIFNFVASYSSSEIIEFMIKESKKLASLNEIKHLLNNENNFGENMLHMAMKSEQSLDFHKALWKVFHEYFKPLEILEILQRKNNQRKSALMMLIEKNPREITNFSWSEIKKCLVKIESQNESSLALMIKECDDILENKINSSTINDIDRHNFELKWNEIEKVIESKINQKVSERNSLKQSVDIFDTLSLQNEIEKYTSAWEYLFNSIENLEFLKFLITHKNISGKNFIHCLVADMKIDVIEQTFNIFREKFDEALYNEILRSKDSHERNLLQVFILGSENFELFQLLWNILRESCKNNDEFAGILEGNDKSNENIFISAVALSRNNFFEFMIKELEKFEMHHKIKQFLQSSNSSGENILQIASKTEAYKKLWKLVRKFFDTEEILKLINHKDKYQRNLLLYALLFGSQEIVEHIFKEVQSVTTGTAETNFLEFLENHDSFSQNILHYCANTGQKEIFEFVWSNVEECFKNCQVHEKFKALAIHRSIQNNSNILHLAAKCDDIKFHEILLKLLLKTFENREEMKKLVIQENLDKSNYIDLIVFEKKSNIFELILQIFQENFNETQFKEILRLKNFHGRNLLMRTFETVSLKTCQFIWKTIQNSCKTEKEFLDFVSEKENSNGNIFNIIATFSLREIFEFTIKELEKMTTMEVIRKLLSNMNSWKRKPLQDAAFANTSLDFHKSLWESFRKNFGSTEVLDLIQQIDVYECNLLHLAVAFNSKEIVELTLNEIVTSLEKLENNEEALKEILKSKSFCRRNLLQIAAFKSQNIQTHQFLWETFRKYFEPSELLEFIKYTDVDGSIILQLAVGCNTRDIAELTYNEIKNSTATVENVEDVLKELIEFKDSHGLNLQRRALLESKDIQMHQFIWNTVRDIYKSNKDLIKYLEKEDDYKNNIFQHTIRYSTNEIFEFMTEELEKFASKEEIRELFSNQDVNEQNILFSAKWNKSAKVHETLWKYLRKFFESSEIFKFIIYENIYGKNIIFNSLDENSKDILIVTWNEIKKSFIKDLKDDNIIEELEDMFENFESKEAKNKLKLKWKEFEQSLKTKFVQENINKLFDENSLSNNLTDFHTFTFSHDEQIHKKVLSHMLTKFENREELKNLIIQKDIFGDNFAHSLVANSKPNIIKLMFKTIKENFSIDQGREILRTKCNRGRNFFHIAARHSKDILVYKTIWREIQQFYRTNEELVDILTSIDHNGRNVFHYIAIFSSGKVFDCFFNELEKVAHDGDVKKHLSILDVQKRNILQYAAQCNEALEIHEKLWKILQECFETSEILNFIHHVNRDGDSLFLIAVFSNTKEIVEFTWKQIKFLMEKDELIEYLTKRGHENKGVREMSLDNKEHRDVNLWIEILLHEYGL